MPIPLGSRPVRLFNRTCVLANGSPGRTLIRKTSLLRIVPTACGQAADIARSQFALARQFAGRANSHWRADTPTPRSRHLAIFIAVQRDHVSMLGDCVSVVTLRHDRISERSFLFTMSDITRPQEAWRPRDGCGKCSLRTSHVSLKQRIKPRSGGARRDRTDDLLLAKQALSQLSYGPGPSAGNAPDKSDTNKMVGLGRLELPTSRLSSARSNQLSYKPESL